MSLGENSRDVNYWPSISDMFLVFFIMAMAIVITCSVSDEVGDKYLVDDVVKEYDSLVNLVAELTGESVIGLRYLRTPHGDFAEEDPEKGDRKRPMLRRKMAKLLQLMDKKELHKVSKHFKTQKQVCREMQLPWFVDDNGFAWAQYPYPIEKGDIIASYRAVRDRYATAPDSAEYGYEDALRLLAFRVLYVGQSVLGQMDAASMARETRMAFAGLNQKPVTPEELIGAVCESLGTDEGHLVATVSSLKKELQEKRQKIRDLEREVERLNKLLTSYAKQQNGLSAALEEVQRAQKKIDELERELEEHRKQKLVHEDELRQLNRIRELLKKIPGLADDSNLDNAVDKLVMLSRDVANSKLYTDSLQEDDVSFEYNSERPVVHQKGREKLDKLLKAFNSAPPSADPVVYEVIIVGHTDNKGNAERNLELGMLRALSIRDTIISELRKEKYGIEFDPKVNICSYSDTYIKFYCYSGSYHNPLIPQAPQTECAANRRVEVKLTRADKDKAESILKDCST